MHIVYDDQNENEQEEEEDKRKLGYESQIPTIARLAKMRLNN